MVERPERTTVQIHRPLHRRLKNLAPYESMTFQEVIDEMADVYEQQRVEEDS